MEYIYRNGTLAATSAATAVLYNAVRGVEIGAYHIGGIAGIVDDVRIYNRALSANEIKRLHESYNPSIKI